MTGGVIVTGGVTGMETWTADDWRDFYEERAAILEYDGGSPRVAAERMALAETNALRRQVRERFTAKPPS